MMSPSYHMVTGRTGFRWSTSARHAAISLQRNELASGRAARLPAGIVAAILGRRNISGRASDGK